mmetsp:Transcript_86100/g.238582  ORF Transcript_86100/g.238582 Transcript_86100/m.238582 type:complete len:209 (-) Transcript_86100:420-1046(-)
MDDEGWVPDRRAVPGLLLGEEFHPERLHQGLYVRDAHPDVLALAEGPQQPGKVLFPVVPQTAPEPLHDERQDLCLRCDGQVVLREDHLDQLYGQLLPPHILGDAAEVPPLSEGSHELLTELLLICRIERGEVVEGEEDVCIKVFFDVLQTQVYHLVNAVLVGEHQQAGYICPGYVHLVGVNKPDQLHELVTRFGNRHLPRDALSEWCW